MDRRRGSAKLALWLLLGGLAGAGALGWAWAEGPPGPNVRLGSPEPPLAEGAPADLTPPLVAIRVRVAASAAAGQELEYRFLIDNRSRAPAHHVLVRASSPSNAEVVRASPEPADKGPGELRWKLDTLDGGASKEIVLIVKPTGAGDVECCARVSFEHGQCVRTKLAGPEVHLKRTGPARAPLNDILTYTLEVANTGRAAAPDVVLEEELPAGLDFLESNVSTPGNNPLVWKLGTLEPGRSRKVEYKAIAKEVGAKTIRGKVSSGGKALDESSANVAVEQAKLSLEINGPERRLLNRPAAYQITLANEGTLPAEGVRVVSVVPTGLVGVVFVSADGGGKLVGNRVEWAVGAMRPGEKRVLQLVLKATKGAGRLTQVVKVEAERGLRAQAETVTEFEAGTGLTMEIDRGPGSLEVGKKAVCTVKVRNQGNAEATGLNLSCTLSDGLKPGAGGGKAEGQTVRFAALEKLAAGGEATFTVEVEAVKAGPARLRAELTADPTGAAPLTGEEALTVIADDAPKPPQSPP
jgi:uncharacterized repeat protein (TIGR01451 family)